MQLTVHIYVVCPFSTRTEKNINLKKKKWIKKKNEKKSEKD